LLTLFTSPSLSLNAATTTYLSTLSLHDALPISESIVRRRKSRIDFQRVAKLNHCFLIFAGFGIPFRVPEVAQLPRVGIGGTGRKIGKHTSELQSRENLVCRLLLEKKKIK